MTRPASSARIATSRTRSRWWLRAIFRWADEGVTIRGIAKRLTAAGVLPPRHDLTGSTEWCQSTVRRILLEERYTGNGGYQFRDHWERTADDRRKLTRRADDDPALIPVPDGVYPAVIDAAQFRRVRDRIAADVKESQRRDRNPEVGVFRRGFARCGLCGRALTVRPRDTTPTTFAYSCNGGGRGCGRSVVNVDLLDPPAWAVVAEVLNRPEVIEERRARLAADDAPRAELAALDAVVSGIAAQQATLAKLAKTLADEEDAAEPIVAELRSLASQRREAEAERAIVAALVADQSAAAARLRAAIDDTAELRRQVGGDVAVMGWDDKRQALHRLGALLTLYPADHRPRWELRLAWGETSGLARSRHADGGGFVWDRSANGRWLVRRPDGAEAGVVGPLSVLRELANLSS